MPTCIRASAPVKPDVPVTFPIPPVKSDKPVSSPSGFLLPDTFILSLCFKFADKQIFSWLGASELFLEIPKYLDPHLSLLPILHAHTADNTWKIFNHTNFNKMNPSVPVTLLNYLC